MLIFSCTSVFATGHTQEVTAENTGIQNPTNDYFQFVCEKQGIESGTAEKSEFLTLNSGTSFINSKLTVTSSGYPSIKPEDFYGYKTLLNEDAKLAEAYLSIAEGIYNGETAIALPSQTIKKDQLGKIYYACQNDFPQFFYIFSGYSYSFVEGTDYATAIYPCYSSTLNKISHSAEFEKAAEDIITASGVNPDMSDYDKALALYNELALRVVYDDDSLAKYNKEIAEANAITDEDERDNAINAVNSKYAYMHSAYAALVTGKAVCDGYSRAYQYLLYKVGILSHITTGKADGGGHAWNLVKLDGEWYYTDLTWGDDSTNNTIFYEYFNMTDSQLVDCRHVVTSSYPMPECTATDLNYFTVNGGKMSPDGDLDNVINQLKKNSYARVYVTGSISDTKKIKDWYYNKIRDIASALDCYGSISYTCFGNSREYHLILFQNTAAPLLNAAIEICSTTDRQCKFYAGFYYENGILCGMYEMPNLTLNENKIITIKPEKVPDTFKEVKYFIWDKAAGLKPVYSKASLSY